jgi:tetratricopeptide (TPR) repeat protein
MSDGRPADLSLADDLMTSGRPAEAVPIYRRWVEARPDEDSHLFALAWALRDSGNRPEAAACFERLFSRELARRLFTGFAFDELVRIYREEKNTQALVSVCERAAEAQPGDAGLLQTLGQAYLAAGNPEAAIGAFEKLVAIDRENPQHWCRLGEAQLAAGFPERAEDAYGRAAGIDPGSRADFFCRLAEGFDRAGYLERGLAAWKKSLASEPDAPLHLMGMGDCLVDLGNPDGAIEAYGRAAGLQLLAAGAIWHRLGNQLNRAGLHLRAAEAFGRAAAAEPQNPLHHLRLAASLTAAGQYGPAETALLRAKALAPSPADR